MDEIMDKNLRSFASWFMKQQEDYDDVIEENKELREKVEDLDRQVKTLIFERDMRLAKMKELEEENDKLREEIDYLNAHN